MELHEPLAFEDARIVGLNSYPSDLGPKCVLILAASLLPAHAAILGCSYIYKEGIPVADLEGVSIEGQLRDIDLHLPSPTNKDEFDCYAPQLIHKFKVKRIEDAKFEIQFRAHEPTRRADLDSLLTAFNKDAFRIRMEPRQQSLFDGGTRVEMGEGEPEDRPLVEVAPLETAELADRSHENKQPGKRGRRRLERVDPPKLDGEEWDNHFDKLHAVAKEEGVEMPEEALIT